MDGRGLPPSQYLDAPPETSQRPGGFSHLMTSGFAAGPRGSRSGSIATLKAQAASTLAPWSTYAGSTLSKVSLWVWCVLPYSAGCCTTAKAGTRAGKNER